jgi:hypothetical protein
MTLCDREYAVALTERCLRSRTTRDWGPGPLAQCSFAVFLTAMAPTSSQPSRKSPPRNTRGRFAANDLRSYRVLGPLLRT